MSTKLVLLGTAGGPLPSTVRSGIAQALVVDGRTYLVDCGSGVTRQLRRARLLARLQTVLLTHLHSDHTCDYFDVFLLGWPILQWNPPVDVYGPGPAGGPSTFPDDDPGHPVPVVLPANPTPGLVELTRAQFEANAYDINVRMREAGRADLTTLVVPHEIALPPDVGTAPPDVVAPPMEPFVVFEDDVVRVTTVLVQHAPVFPAFAFRFDTADGSVVLSGDTAPCANLTTLARAADILVHEVFDDETDREHEDERGSWEAERRQHHLVTSHTGLSRVGAVAAEAGAGRLVLTHFVPGDDTLPDEHWLEGVGPAFGGEVIVGRDMLELAL
jgi:ribonuclease BN (tRNA processing enzyme)